MSQPELSALWSLLEAVAGTRRTERLFQLLKIPAALLATDRGWTTRAEMAQALNMLLFEDLLERVPEALAYAEDTLAAGRRAHFDHGALRTLAGTTSGSLPEGHRAFARILEPLGFRVTGIYDLDAICATGRAYTHVEHPEGIAQFFVSEIHVDRFSAPVRAAAARVVAESQDPMPNWSFGLLDRLAIEGVLPDGEAARLLPNLLACFSRRHPIPRLADYEILRAESPELAWFATEGCAYNHATDRVSDVVALAQELHARGIPMKDCVERSASGRIFQTATLAAPVRRPFRGPDGRTVLREVPGSFYEFITRMPLPEGGLDLAFDASSATGIFRVTSPAR